MTFRVASIFNLLFFICLVPAVTNAVYSDQLTNPDMRKHLVNVVLSNGTCSGVLVAKNVVLTAAHCRDMMGEPSKVVVLSENEEDKKCNFSDVVAYDYTPNAQPIFPRNVHAPDLLILKLKSDLCTGRVAKISEDVLQPGDVLEHTGFGGNGHGAWFNSRQLSLEIIPNEGATDLNTSNASLFKRLLELSEGYYLYAKPVVKNTTACTGDSGGPLFVNNDGDMHLMAINGAVFPNDQLGADKCNRGYLHLATPIAPYYDWIKSKIELWAN